MADPGDYTLLFSPGIINSPDNVGSAPEPPIWAMMLLGFAGLPLWLTGRPIDPLQPAHKAALILARLEGRKIIHSGFRHREGWMCGSS